MEKSARRLSGTPVYCAAGRPPEIDANAAAAASEIVTSLSLLRLATPTAPTTCSPAFRGAPPRNVISSDVIKARRPLLTRPPSRRSAAQQSGGAGLADRKIRTAGTDVIHLEEGNQRAAGIDDRNRTGSVQFFRLVLGRAEHLLRARLADRLDGTRCVGRPKACGSTG